MSSITNRDKASLETTGAFQARGLDRIHCAVLSEPFSIFVLQFLGENGNVNTSLFHKGIQRTA